MGGSAGSAGRPRWRAWTSSSWRHARSSWAWRSRAITSRATPWATVAGSPAWTCRSPSATTWSPTSGVSPPRSGAGRREWRAPPLWGVRDSAPYLHDGRAPTLEKAIELHQGDATVVAGRYRDLPSAKRFQLLQFLKSLAAPRQVARKGVHRGP